MAIVPRSFVGCSLIAEDHVYEFYSLTIFNSHAAATTKIIVKSTICPRRRKKCAKMYCRQRHREEKKRSNNGNSPIGNNYAAALFQLLDGKQLSRCCCCCRQRSHCLVVWYSELTEIKCYCPTKLHYSLADQRSTVLMSHTAKPLLFTCCHRSLASYRIQSASEVQNFFNFISLFSLSKRQKRKTKSYKFCIDQIKQFIISI